ncbi:MAG: hypothetical protein CMI13_13890 [Oleibacter sp.]|nr:hypothetical protein [Thalassolituus sp.]|tara:strand:+ start:1427 stop:2911 length:1485 start_codon:yes stop_codon:yes gene_type:complete
MDTKENKLSRSVAAALIAIAGNTYAVADDARENYDLNGNGLIEINSLSDLNKIRDYSDPESEFNLTAPGCPDEGCTGFELTADLDFDTNGDGVIDENDDYWNEGLGWQPIGTESNPFGTVFEGNGHSIKNLYINRPDSNDVGLFGYVRLSTGIRNLILDGALTSVTGKDYVGLLTGHSVNTPYINLATSGDVYGENYVGGLVGSTTPAGSYSHISHSYTRVNVVATGNNVGGIAGEINSANIEYSFSAANITGNTDVGGIVGIGANGSPAYTYFTGNITATGAAGGLVGSNRYSSLNIYKSWANATFNTDSSAENIGALIGYAGSVTINDSYWATESAEYADGSGLATINNSSGHEESVLRCPTAANDTDCTTDSTLYRNWHTATYQLEDETEVQYWDFGTAEQLPALSFYGYVLRDSDGDGVWDFEDAYPDDPTRSEPDPAPEEEPENTDPENEGAPEETPENESSGGGSSGGGSLIWLFGLAPLMTLRRKSC